MPKKKPEEPSAGGRRGKRPAGKRQADKKRRPTKPTDIVEADTEEEKPLSEMDQFMETYGTDAVAGGTSSGTNSTKSKTPQRPKIRRKTGDLDTVATGMLIQGGVAVAATAIWLAMLIMASRKMISFDALANSWPLYLLAALAFVAGESMGVTAPKASRTQFLCIAGLACTVLAAICWGINYMSPSNGETVRTVLSAVCFGMLMIRVIATAAFLVRISRYADLAKYETQATFAMVGQPFALTAAMLYVLYAPQVTEDMTSGLRLATRGSQIWIVVTVVSVAVMYVSTLIGMGRTLRRESH